jgi:hypothetical protein
VGEENRQLPDTVCITISGLREQRVVKNDRFVKNDRKKAVENGGGKWRLVPQNANIVESFGNLYQNSMSPRPYPGE